MTQKPYAFRCLLCGKEAQSVSMRAALAVMRRHRDKDHAPVAGRIGWRFTRVDGRSVTLK